MTAETAIAQLASAVPALDPPELTDLAIRLNWALQPDRTPTTTRPSWPATELYRWFSSRPYMDFAVKCFDYINTMPADLWNARRLAGYHAAVS